MIGRPRKGNLKIAITTYRSNEEDKTSKRED